MNVIQSGIQSDTKRGDITLPGVTSNLTGLEGYLVKIVNTAGAANFTLPTAVADQAFFVVLGGDVAGNPIVAEAPSLDENCRVAIDATYAINPGDMLSLSPNTYGKLYKPPGGAGAGFYTFIAEEAAAAGAVGQLLKVRRIPDRAFNL